MVTNSDKFFTCFISDKIVGNEKFRTDISNIRICTSFIINLIVKTVINIY